MKEAKSAVSTRIGYIKSKLTLLNLILILFLLAGCGDTTNPTSPEGPVTRVSSGLTLSVFPTATATPGTPLINTQITLDPAKIPTPSPKPATIPASTKAPTPTSEVNATAEPDISKTLSVTEKGPFRLRIGQSARLASLNLSVKFLDVTDEFRCPVADDPNSFGVACATSGTVTGIFEIKPDGQAAPNISLTWGSSRISLEPGTGKETARFDKFYAKVLEVAPRRFSIMQNGQIVTVPIEKSAYEFTLVVAKNP